MFLANGYYMQCFKQQSLAIEALNTSLWKRETMLSGRFLVLYKSETRIVLCEPTLSLLNKKKKKILKFPQLCVDKCAEFYKKKKKTIQNPHYLAGNCQV